MGFKSGTGGDVKSGVTQVSDVKSWSGDFEALTTRVATNKTGGFKKTIVGTKQAQGSMDCVYDAANPPMSGSNPVFVGASLTADFYTTATLFIRVPCVIKNVKFKVDVDSGAYTGYTADWESDGAWTDMSAGEEAPEGMGLPEGAEPLTVRRAPAAPSAAESATTTALAERVGGLEAQLAEILSLVKRPPAEVPQAA